MLECTRKLVLESLTVILGVRTAIWKGTDQAFVRGCLVGRYIIAPQIDYLGFCREVVIKVLRLNTDLVHAARGRVGG